MSGTLPTIAKRTSRLMFASIVSCALVSTGGCKSKDSDGSKPRPGRDPHASTDASSSQRDPAHHHHAKSWSLQKLLGSRQDRFGFEEKARLLGADIETLKRAHGKALRQKTSGWVLELPPIGRRTRKTYVLLETDATTHRVTELVVLFPMATDDPKIRAGFERHWGKPKPSKQHKCRLRGCVYRERDPTIVIKQIDTKLMWSIRVLR